MLAKPKSIMSESKASVIDMQAVGLLDGPQYERRRAAQIDRAPARGERPSAANGDMVTVVRKSLPEKNLAFPLRRRIDSLCKRFLPSGDESVRAECAGAGRKFAVSAVIAVSVATSVQCVQNDTVVSERKRRSSNGRCNNFVVKDSVAKHRKQRDKKLDWAVHVVCPCVWRMRLFLYTLDKPGKNGDAKIQARPTLTTLGTRRKSENSG